MSKKQYSNGYVLIQVDGMPMSEHRYIMEQHIGRRLAREEEVHHLNGNRSDNRIENLVLCKNKLEHISKYHTGVNRKRHSEYKSNKALCAVSIDANILDEFKKIANLEALNISEWMRRLVKEYLNERRNLNGKPSEN